MKDTLRHLLSGVLFLALGLGLLLPLSRLFLPKDNSAEAGIHDPTPNGILGEPEDTIDVLILGDSEALSGISPLDIWENSGITSHVCAGGNQKLFLTREYLDRAFAGQSPKLVILEANCLYSNMGRMELITHWAQRTFPVVRYHDRWKSLGLRDWQGTVSYTHTHMTKGYHYNTDVHPANADDYMAPSDEAAAIHPRNRQWLEGIAEACGERGAQLVLVSVPSSYNWNSPRHNGVEALARELGLTYLDMNLMPREVPIDWNTDTRDYGNHLNYRGARKVSLFLAEYLTDSGLFRDKRQEAEYAAWEQAWQYFRENAVSVPG
ncbi:MAG: hypothetical protein SPE19_08035 [Candidatus Faecousia sp.]|nr:hypothetical protein [Candidatus Faecousia sp.]